MKTIAILGCGNLGQAIIRGLLEENYPAEKLIATRRKIEKIDFLAKEGVQITNDNIAAAKIADIVILAVKPYIIQSVLEEIKAVIDPKKQMLVSLATGVSVKTMLEALGEGKEQTAVVRAMPNTAADVGESLTCLYAHNCGEEQRSSVEGLFNAIGKSIFIDESLMEAATILGACGIAYVLRFIRAMIQGGIQVGFSAETATAIVTQTVKGAAELLIERGEHPEREIDKVTTPKGCTIVGLNEMEHSGFSSSLIKGIVASYDAIEPS
jgi:pyrroline-5-carboxylate reductase